MTCFNTFIFTGLKNTGKTTLINTLIGNEVINHDNHNEYTKIVTKSHDKTLVGGSSKYTLFEDPKIKKYYTKMGFNDFNILKFVDLNELNTRTEFLVINASKVYFLVSPAEVDSEESLEYFNKIKLLNDEITIIYSKTDLTETYLLQSDKPGDVKTIKANYNHKYVVKCKITKNWVVSKTNTIHVKNDIINSQKRNGELYKNSYDGWRNLVIDEQLNDPYIPAITLTQCLKNKYNHRRVKCAEQGIDAGSRWIVYPAIIGAIFSGPVGAAIFGTTGSLLSSPMMVNAYKKEAQKINNSITYLQHKHDGYGDKRVSDFPDINEHHDEYFDEHVMCNSGIAVKISAEKTKLMFDEYRESTLYLYCHFDKYYPDFNKNYSMKVICDNKVIYKDQKKLTFI
jgi:hypothetical protein